jgi:alkylation response protein AidB-like acyl-CoA dehydrogenase
MLDRMKRKMGTSELPTAEITYDGAVAYPVGPLESGLANVVGIILTYSRLTIGLASAASMARAAREARKYAEFRTAFGRKIYQFPMVANQVARLEKYAHRTIAGAFKLYQAFLRHKDKLSDKLDGSVDSADQKERFDIRELIMLQKITATWDCTDVLRGAMSIFGGHGVMEDFSARPRLFRDAAIN